MIKSIQEFLQFIFKEEDSETFVFESPIEGSLLSFRLFWGGLFTFFYFIIGVLSLKIATVHLSISPVWPPTGIAILGMVLFGRPLLPFVFAGALAVNLYIGGNFGVAGLIALGNALESYVGFFVIAKVYQWRFYFQQSFLLLATLSSAIIAPIISASIGVLSLYYFGELPAEKIKISWFTWWTGDFVGALLIVPFYILANRDFREICFRSFMKKKIWGSGIIFLSLLGLYLTFLFLEFPQSVSWLFIIFLLLVLVGSLRSESFSLIYINLLCAVVVGVTLTGKGPFNLSQLNQNILNLEVFLTALIISNLGLISIFRSSSYRPFVFVLICGWLFWGSVYYKIQSTQVAENHQKIQDIIDEHNNSFKAEMNRHIAVLTGGGALFMASNNVTSQEWKNYYNYVQRFYDLPGVLGMGVIFKVPFEDKQKFIDHQKKNMDPQFSIRQLNPPTLNQDLFVITYIEPFDKNKMARGLDVGSEKNRRDAAIGSMASGRAQMTQTIQLVQDNVKRAGFLIFQPVYKIGMPTATDEERIANFSHWIYSPVISEHFFKSVVQKIPKQFFIEVFDIKNGEIDAKIFSNEASDVNVNYDPIFRKVELNGHEFYVKWQVTREYFAKRDFTATWIAFLGAISVLMLSYFIVNMMGVKGRAEKLARKLFDEFSDSMVILQRQESQIIESAKMASLGEMASGIAHEINNPLAIISTTSSSIERIVRKNPDNLENQKILQLTQRISNTVDRIAKIVKSLRQFARDGERDPMELVSIEKVIEDTMTLCAQRFKNGNVDLKIKLDFKGFVKCREVQLSQVILNLLNNAFDAIENKDEKWVEVQTVKNKNWVEIRVSDCGHGIPKEIQDKILQPFFTTKEVGKGTGLGLSISKGIIESHGGNLTIDNEAKNTTFVARIPLEEASVLNAA